MHIKKILLFLTIALSVISCKKSTSTKDDHLSSLDIYMGGEVQKENSKIATIWKNNETISLSSPSTTSSGVYKVFINDHDIYAVGYYVVGL